MAGTPTKLNLQPPANSLVLIIAVRVKLDGDELKHHPQLVNAVVISGRQEVAPRSPVVLADELNRDVLLLAWCAACAACSPR